MLEILRRYQRDILVVVIAVIVALFSYQALRSLPYYPTQWQWLILGIIAVVTLMSPRAGIALALLFHVPAVGRLSIEMGTLYLAISLLLIASSGDNLVSAFLLLGMIVAAGWFEPLSYLLFVVPPLAGFLFGTSGGMMLAASAALFAELLGMMTGRAMIGPVYAGGVTPLFQPLPPVASILELSWLNTGLSNFNMLSFLANLLRPFVLDPQFAAQIGLWLVSGYFSARLVHQERRWSRENALAIAVGVGILALGHILVAWGLAGYRVPIAQVLLTGLASGLIGFLVYPLLEYVNQISAGFDLR